MKNKKDKRTGRMWHIVVTDKVHEELKNFSIGVGSTYEDVVKVLLKFWKEKHDEV